MLVFLFALLICHKPYIKAENPLCQKMGDPKYPLLFKNGDVTIGGLFSIRSIEILPSFDFIQKPQLLSCSRFVTLYTI